MRSAIDRFFGIAAAGSSIPVEVRAGITTFLTMSYVLFVNLVLGNAIVVPDGFAKLLVVTALAAAIGSARRRPRDVRDAREARRGAA